MMFRAALKPKFVPRQHRSTGVEPLESRRLLHAAVDLTFSFQPKHNPVPATTVPDVGEVYGDRGDGMTFGWNANNSRNMRDRYAKLVKKNDTFAQLQAGGTFAWEIALPNGDYRVSISSGDLRYPDGTQVIRAEGVSAIKGDTTAKQPILSATKIVTVSDGRLTIKTAKGARNAKLNTLRVQTYHADTEVEPKTAVVSVSAVDGSATEGSSDAGLIRLTRDGGDLARSLTVNLAWSGSAGTKDIGSRPTSLTFSATQTIIDLNVTARTDSLVEADETAKVSIASGSGYTVVKPGAASVVIHDATVIPDPTPDPTPDPDPTAGTLSWTTTTSALTPHTEAQSEVIGGKFYRFGGYNGNYSATRRVERYDPATATWTRMNDMPIGLTHAGTAMVNDHEVWFAGAYAERVGSPGLQDIAVTNVWIYNATDDSWRAGPSLPDARGSGGLAYISAGGTHKLYFISGERAGDRTDMTTVWMYDLDQPNDGWTTRTPIPQGRSHFGTVVLNNKIYVFGGQVNHDASSSMLDTTYVYDPATNAWTQLANMPTPMSHLAPASVAFHGKIYSFGGDYPVYVASQQAREYDPATNTWKLITNLPIPRAALVAGVIGDQFIISGGKDHVEWSVDTFIGSWS